MSTAATRPSAFGPFVSASDVELALLEHVQLWLADYLAEVDRRYDDDVGTLPYPRGWVISADVEKMPEDQTPAIVVASPGLLEPIELAVEIADVIARDQGPTTPTVTPGEQSPTWPTADIVDVQTTTKG
jgi:hypothetical protein